MKTTTKFLLTVQKQCIASLLIFQLGTFNCSANNLTLGSTITIVSGNQISFTIKWDNSWYVSTVPSNWDAVWLFVKYKDCATTDWQHALLSTTPGDHTVAGGGGLLSVEMPAVNDGKGVFIRRTAVGSGNIAVAETVTLKLNGIATGSYNFKVFGIEMVKILNENFQVGDGAAISRFNSITITSEAALNYATLGGAGTNNPSGVPINYPKGWNAFYCMKYEITQEQYVDFLNTLTYDQQASRTEIAPNSVAFNWAMLGLARNSVKIVTQGVASTTPATYACDGDADNNFNETTRDNQNVPISRIKWGDLVAYLDWACLRPMSDLEFEKICRGPLGRIGGEYAWGNNTTLTRIATGGGQIANWGSFAESKSLTSGGRCVYGADTWLTSNCPNTAYISYGPARAGITATAATTRVQGGVSYYGVLDMSGNLLERVVATNAAGSTFTGTLGDGTLDASGNATNTTDSGGDWPAYSTASGSGYRGGDWYTLTTANLQVSNRSGATATNATRLCNFGGRGVR